jgi:exosome complex component RRP42
LNDAGNLFDASSLGAIAALKDLRFPKFDGEKIDYKEKTDKKLELGDTPLSVTVCKIGNKFIVDPISEEEKVIDARLTVATTSKGDLCAMQKGGDAPLSKEDIMQMIKIAKEKTNELRGAL